MGKTVLASMSEFVQTRIAWQREREYYRYLEDLYGDSPSEIFSKIIKFRKAP